MRDLCLLDDLDPDLVVNYAEYAVIVVDVALKSTVFLVELSDEAITQIRHCTAEGIEDIGLKVHKINRELLVAFDL